MLTDNFNRTITLTTQEGEDSYFVTDNATPIPNSFTIAYPAGTPWEQVLNTINSMAPPQNE